MQHVWNALRLFFLLSLSLPMAGSFARAQPLDQISNGGEVEITPVQTEEPIKIHYEYGAIPSEEKITPEESHQLTQNIDQIQGAFHNENPILVFEEEGNPVELPQELVEHQKNNILRLKVPAIFTKKHYQDAYVKPTKGDRVSGVVFAIMRGAPTAMVWFAKVDPEWAAAMTVWVLSSTYLMNTYHATLDNVFDLDLPERKTIIGKLWNKMLVGSAYLTFDLALGNIGNAVGGMRLSPLQASINTAVLGAVNNAFNINRNATFKGRTDLKLTYSILYRPFIYLMRGFQDVNGWPALFSLGAYEITHSMLASFAIYGGLFALNVLAKDQVLKTVEKIRFGIPEKLKQFGGWIQTQTTDACNALLNGRSSPTKGDDTYLEN